MKTHEKHRSGTHFGAFFFTLTAGLVTGVLLAPMLQRHTAKMRNQLGEKVRDTANAARDRVNDLADNMVNKVEKVAEKVEHNPANSPQPAYNKF